MTTLAMPAYIQWKNGSMIADSGSIMLSSGKYTGGTAYGTVFKDKINNRIGCVCSPNPSGGTSSSIAANKLYIVYFTTALKHISTNIKDLDGIRSGLNVVFPYTDDGYLDDACGRIELSTGNIIRDPIICYIYSDADAPISPAKAGSIEASGYELIDCKYGGKILYDCLCLTTASEARYYGGIVL